MATLNEFEQANSKNLPDMNVAMILEYSMTSNKYNIDELRSVKTLMDPPDSYYVECAVGNVELMREDPKCIVQAKIVLPEQKVEKIEYFVSVIMNEKEKTVTDTSCNGCPESAGGCKHTLLLLFWLEKKPALAPTPSGEKYWTEICKGEPKVLDKDIRNLRGKFIELELKNPEDKKFNTE